jgi:cytochrome P450
MAGGSVHEEPFRLGREFFQDPHATYRELLTEGRVRYASLSPAFGFWLVTRYADAKALLSDPRLSKDSARAKDLFAEGAGRVYGLDLFSHMLQTDPPDHTRLRRLVNKAFTNRAVAGLRPRIEQITDGLLDDLGAVGRADLIESFASPLPIAVICEMLGVPAADHAKFRSWVVPLITAASPDDLRTPDEEMRAYLTALIAEKRAEPTKDLLSDLVHVSDQGDQLSGPELLSMAFLLLVAGYETTVNLIGNGVLALVRHPDRLAALRSDPSLLPEAVEELLRYDGSLNLATLRFTTEPVRVGEVEIPADEFVLISLLAANRDPRQFPDPDRFDTTRGAGGGHLAFGHGIHYCVGAPLARLEAQVAIGRLLDRFGTIELDGDPADLRWHRSPVMHGLERLPIRVGS